MIGTGKIISIIKSIGATKKDISQEIQTQLPGEVSDWLDEHITNPDSPPLDRSLSSSSSAAPADMVGDLKCALISIESETVYENDTTVESGSTQIYTFTNPILSGFSITIKNTGSSGAFSVNFVKADGTYESIALSLSYNADPITVTVDYDVYGIRSYVNSTQWSFKVSYGGFIERIDSVKSELTDEISTLKHIKTINHNEAVTTGTNNFYTLDSPIGSGTSFTITNNANTGMFTVNLIDAEGNVVIASNGIAHNTSAVIVAPFDVYRIRSYVNNTEWNFTITYGGQIDSLEASVQSLEENVNALDQSVDKLGRDDLVVQGILDNIFSFLTSTYYKGYTATISGVTYEILGNNKIRLDGTATANFNINLAFKSFNVKPVMYYYVKVDDTSITVDDVYLHAGYYKVDGTAVGGSVVSALNEFVEKTLSDDADTSRCYMHVNSGAVFDNTVIEFIAYEEKPMILEFEESADQGLSATDIFNAEPFTGTYDWQTPVVNYGALFKGKSNVESFAFFTDPHVLGFADDNRNETRMENYLKRVQKVYNSTPCSFIVSGGDWLNNSTTMDEACYRLGYLKGIAKHLLDGCHLVMGNHDTNYQGKLDSESNLNTGRLTDATIASIMYRDTDTKKAYYSFDGSNSKCYVLDTGSEHNTMLAYDWEQVAWLAEKLVEDDAEHSIIFLHIITSSNSVQINTSNFATLVEAYNSHTTVTMNDVTYDFTSCTGHVDFWVGGHTHSDSTGTLGGIPYFITATNAYTSDVPIIDLVLVDYDANTINLVRVGGTGSDRTISLSV